MKELITYLILFNKGSQVEVKLIGKVPNAEKIIAAGSRGTRIKTPAYMLLDKIDKKEAESIDHHIVNLLGHDAITEFSFYIFSVTGISRVLTHQLVRHRIASYLQMSSRAVSMENSNYIIPETIKNQDKANKLFIETVRKNNEVYKKLVDKFKVPKEDARYLIPSGVQTNIIMGMNVRSLMNFFKLRLCRCAQWEIRDLAEKIRDIVKKESPVLFLKAEKPCVIDEKCNREKGSCKYVTESGYKVERARYLKEKKKFDLKK